jgi:hypothetical protein
LASQDTFIDFPIGGYSNHFRVENTVWTFKNVLRSEIMVAALFDRDYRLDEEIEEFLREIGQAVPTAFVLDRKEIENYLLVPDAIARATRAELRRRRDAGAPSIEEPEVWPLLLGICEELRLHVSSQFAAHRLAYFTKSSKDPSTVLRESGEWFEARWADPYARLKLVPGKRVLADLGGKLQQTCGGGLTAARIIASMTIEDVADDLKSVLEELDRFAERE